MEKFIDKFFVLTSLERVLKQYIDWGVLEQGKWSKISEFFWKIVNADISVIIEGLLEKSNIRDC